MGERREKVVFEFNSDGTKLETGIDGLQRKAARAAAEAKKLQKEFEKAGGTVKQHLGGTANRAVGDLINGLTSTSGAVSRLNVLTHSLGLGTGIATGALVAVQGIEKLAEAARESQREMDALRESSQKLGKASIFSTPAQGAESLIQARQAAREQMHKAQERMVELDPEGTKGIFGSAAGAVAETFMQVRAYMQLTSLSKQQMEAAQQMAQAQTIFNQRTNQVVAALADELTIQEKLKAGRALEAKAAQVQLEYEKRAAEIRAEFGDYSDQARTLLNISNSELAVISKEAAIRDAQFAHDSKRLLIYDGIKNKAERIAAILRDQLKTAHDIESVKGGNDFERTKLGLQTNELANQQREDVRGRFYNADGSRKLPSQLTLDQQKENRVQRSIDRFLKSHDSVTGKPMNANVSGERPSDAEWNGQFGKRFSPTHMERRTFIPTKNHLDARAEMSMNATKELHADIVTLGKQIEDAQFVVVAK